MLKDHLFPKTVEEAISLLEKYRGRARLIAGGTDLVIAIREKKQDFEILVDIERIETLRSIREEDGKIFIGSGVTFTGLEESELVNTNALALSQAASTVGGPQIRNRGTIGGNIVSAQPAADGALALFAFDAILEITGPGGTRKIPIDQAYQNVGESCIDPSKELLIGLWLEKGKKGEGSNYQRVAIRRALQLPILACAVLIRVEKRLIRLSRIAIGPVANVPFRSKRAEEFLEGKPLSDDIFRKAGEMVSEEARPRHSRLRGSRSYRKRLAVIISRRGLAEAAMEAGRTA